MKPHDRNSRKRKKQLNRSEVLLSQHMLILKMNDLEVSDLRGEIVHIMQHMYGGKQDIL